jgi:putative ABC transport system permease protein
VTDAFAHAHGLALGSSFDLMTASGKRTFVVRGTLGSEGASRAFGGRFAVMDIDAARVAFGKEGRVDRADVVPRPGVDEGELARRLAAALPPGFAVERPAEQSKAFERMAASYQALLSLLSGLSLVIAVFLVSNTMGLAVAERRKEIGMIRAIGGTRAVVLVTFLVEAVVLSLVGSLAGVALGRLLAQVLVKSVSASMSGQLGTPIEAASLVLTQTHVVIALVTGVVTGIGAGIVPAYRATRVSPVEALRSSESEPTSRSRVRSALAPALGLALLAYVTAVSLFHLDQRFVVVQRTTLLVALVGSLLATPWLARPAVRVVHLVCTRGPLARVAPLRLAATSLLRNETRSRAGAMSVVVGLVLVVLLTTIHHSFRASLDDATGKMLTADLWVSSSELFMSGAGQPLREDLADEIASAAGLDRARDVRAQRFIRTKHEGYVVALKAWDRMPEDRLPFVVTDRPASDAARELHAAGGPTVLVSENFVARFGKKTGDVIDLDTPSGKVAFRIVGVIFEFAAPDGTLYVDRDVYRRLWRDDLVSVFLVFVPKGVAAESARTKIDEQLGRRGLTVSVTEGVRDTARKFLDECFAYTRAIELAALLVGILGLLNTVLVGMIERSRELAALRAVGMSRGQLRAMVLIETVIVGVVAAAVATFLGAYLARVWLGGAIAIDLGWPVPMNVPWAAVLSVVTAGTLAGALAGLAAAHRAGRIALREALATE